MASKQSFRLVSFDGGGPRSFSQLAMMKSIMHQICVQHPDSLNKKKVPFEYFDLMGGSDTGGILVILFIKMKMSVEESIKAFSHIIEEVYAKGLKPKQRTERLRRCMEDLLKQRGLPLDLKLEEDNRNGGCYGFVMAASSLNVEDKVCFRTYHVENEEPSGITVVNAALATCALPLQFLPVSISDAPDSFPYSGAGVGANNPVRQVISEASLNLQADPGVLLSLGSGHPGILALDLDRGDLSLNSLTLQMMVDCQREDLEVRQQMNHPEFYFRFSVDHGLQKNDPRAKSNQWISAQTNKYIKDSKPRVSEFVQKMIGIEGNVSAPHDSGGEIIQGPNPDPMESRPFLLQEAFSSHDTLRSQNRHRIIDALREILFPGATFGNPSR